MTENTEVGVQRLCPHWYRDAEVHLEPIMFVVHERQKCRLCGHQRFFVTLPPSHPTRDGETAIEEIQQPGRECIHVGEPSKDVTDMDI